LKYRIEIRAKAGTTPESLASGIQSSINRALGRDASRVTADAPSIFDKADTERTVYVDADVIRVTPKGGINPDKIRAAIVKGASPALVITVREYKK
jgi:hypothetical protein